MRSYVLLLCLALLGLVNPFELTMLRPFSRVAISTTRLTVTQRTSSRLAAAQRTGWLHTASSSVSDTPEFKPIHEIRSPSYTKSIGDCSRILVSEHTINCPLDYSDLSFGTIEVHATVVDLLPESAESSKITSYLNAGYAPNEMAEQYKVRKSSCPHKSPCW